MKYLLLIILCALSFTGILAGCYLSIISELGVLMVVGVAITFFSTIIFANTLTKVIEELLLI